MGKTYKRLSLKERESISRYLAQGKSLNKIAKKLKRHKSTISREVNRGSQNQTSYRAVTANRRAKRNASKRKYGKRKLNSKAQLRKIVFQKLRLQWSPEQIADWLKNNYPDNQDMRLSHEAIYSYIYVLPRGELKKDLIKQLRRSHKYRYKQKGKNSPKRGLIPNMTSIDERPKEIEERRIVGHWEGDLIAGKNNKSALGTIVERKMRYVMLVKLNNREADHVANRYAIRFNRIPKKLRKSLTYDQGREMTDHEKLTEKTKIKVYFAHPRSPWERGTNENTNGLIRQYFPKGTDFNKISSREIKKIEKRLNGRPRKTLNFATPEEVYNQAVGVALKF
jgi:IS30 family transposase